MHLDFKWLFGVIATTEYIPSYVTTSKCLSVYSPLIVPAEWHINPPARNFRHFLHIENYEILKKRKRRKPFNIYHLFFLERPGTSDVTWAVDKLRIVPNVMAELS